MCRSIALTAGFFILAGQAAAGEPSDVRIGDRPGSTASDISASAGVQLPALLAGAGRLVVTVVVAGDDDLVSG